MRFDLTIPNPSLMRVEKDSYVSLVAGIHPHRFHLAAYQAEEFNRTNAGDARSRRSTVAVESSSRPGITKASGNPMRPLQ
jgi:hypothetical protein